MLRAMLSSRSTIPLLVSLALACRDSSSTANAVSLPMNRPMWGDRRVYASLSSRWIDGQLSYKIDVVPDTEYVTTPPGEARVTLYDDKGFVMASFHTTLFPRYSRGDSARQPSWRKYIRSRVQGLGVTGVTPCPSSTNRTTLLCTKRRYLASRLWRLEPQ